MSIIKNTDPDGSENRSVRQIRKIHTGSDHHSDQQGKYLKIVGNRHALIKENATVESKPRILEKVKPKLAKPVVEQAAKPSQAAPSQAELQAHAELSADLQAKRDNLDAELDEYRQTQLEQINQEFQQHRQQQLQELETEKQQQLQQGYDEGSQKAKAELEHAFKEKIQAYLDGINQLAEEKKKVYVHAEDDILKLTTKAAELIVQKELHSDKDTILHIVRDAIKKITDKDKVIVRVNHEDIDLVRQNKDALLDLMPDIKNLEIQDDPRLKEGSCIIETKMGYIDSSLSTKLDSLSKALFKEYKEIQEENAMETNPNDAN